MTDDIELTPSQQAALETVRNRPGMTLDFYATVIISETVEGDVVFSDIDFSEQIVSDLGFLIFNGFIKRDPNTGALTTKG